MLEVSSPKTIEEATEFNRGYDAESRFTSNDHKEGDLDKQLGGVSRHANVDGGVNTVEDKGDCRQDYKGQNTHSRFGVVLDVSLQQSNIANHHDDEVPNEAEGRCPGGDIFVNSEDEISRFQGDGQDNENKGKGALAVIFELVDESAHGKDYIPYL